MIWKRKQKPGYWEITRQVKGAFDPNGISFPYPTSDVRYLEVPKQVKKKGSDPILLPVVVSEPEEPESQTEEGQDQKLEINPST